MKYVYYRQKKSRGAVFGDIVAVLVLLAVGGVMGLTLAFSLIVNFMEIDDRHVVETEYVFTKQ